ncbi:MAG TPA: hypothetical protein VML96_03795 [Egibacteraceae bacterium]|nr:hypothetical protein [Egibacteraceae bacterium]
MSGGAWIASYVILWVAVAMLSLAVIVLLRQIGVLHARIRPMGVHFANEGPTRDAPAPLPQHFDFGSRRLTLVTFTSEGCRICQDLLPSIRALERQYEDLGIDVVSLGPGTQEVFNAYSVRSTPYVVGVDSAGVVRGGGVANTLEQIEVLVESCLEGSSQDG